MRGERQRNPIKTILSLLLIILILVSIAGFIAFNWYTGAINNPPTQGTDTVSFTIKEGENLTSIAPELERKGLINSDLALRIYLRFNDVSANIKPGTYDIPKNLTIDKLIAQLETGVFKKNIWVTLREALRPDQAATIINEKFNEVGEMKRFSENEYIDIAENPENYIFSDNIQSFIDKYKPKDKPLIGFLYPDTYNFDGDATAQFVIEKQIETLIKRLEENNINLENYNSTPETPTFYDSLILASIIDKESGGSDDRQMISSVFHNRIADGMPLQSDATINFFTRRDDPRSTIAETQIDNPYNSYKYAGLVPTPINSPGIQSIYAAIYPKESSYYYFRHDKAANIYFSETYNEHLLNISLYP